MKEQIHALSEEMIANLGRLVAIDSQLGTPEEGKPFGAGPMKALEEGLYLCRRIRMKISLGIIIVVMVRGVVYGPGTCLTLVICNWNEVVV